MLGIWFLIVCAVLLGRHLFRKWVDSWPQPDPPPPPPEDHSKDPDWCKIHNTWRSCTNFYSECPGCDRDYHDELRLKIYPPGINSSNVRWFRLEDWRHLRLIDLAWEDGEITKAEAIAKKKGYIRDEVLIRGEGPDEEAINNEIRERCSHYAGAAEYSGITIPK